MKLLGNPYIVGALSLLALALLAPYAIKPLARPHPSSAPRNSPSPRPAAPASAANPAYPLTVLPTNPATAPTLAAPAGPAHELPSQRLERDVDRPGNPPPAEASVWGESLRRDPFQGRSVTAPNPENAAQRILALQAILRQSDSRWVVINNQVRGEGETIQGYRIETIEDGRVWLRGPHGRESLTFHFLTPEAHHEKNAIARE
jgi:hypothetical protein